jgi:hypothetical protein
LVGMADAKPATQFTDSALELDRLQSGDSYPMVSAWQEGDGSWTIEVSLWSSNESPSPGEASSLRGTLAEIIASTKL